MVCFLFMMDFKMLDFALLPNGAILYTLKMNKHVFKGENCSGDFKHTQKQLVASDIQNEKL